MKYVLLSCTGLFLLAACGNAQEEGQMSADQVAKEMAKMNIEPGQWEATNEILSASAPGIPPDALRSMVGQKNTVSNCVTPEQAAKPSASFLAGQKNSECTYQDFALNNGKMKGTISCTGGQLPGKMIMKMEGQYSSSSYDMNMNMDAAGLPGGMKMTVVAKTTARRIGSCA